MYICPMHFKPCIWTNMIIGKIPFFLFLFLISDYPACHTPAGLAGAFAPDDGLSLVIEARVTAGGH